MIDRSQLLSDLQSLLRQLETDLAERSDLAELPEVREALLEEYERARAAERTAFSYEQWRSDYATQVAVAWVLGAVFARFLEDNALVSLPKLAGPGERLQRARDEHELYFREHPTETDREYLLVVFRELGQLPGMGAIFLEQSPVLALPNWLSGDAAGELLRFFQKIDPETGTLVHDFTDESWDTRFLGDLYQDLSAEARKRYALLQTPIFVEEFILDRTLDPAIEEFGLDEFRMIDPACGSGHFLLGAFERILDRWQKKEPSGNVRNLAQWALDSVHGVDVNLFAVAIARFRLLLAAMKASGIDALKNAPGFTFRLACGDSLLHGEGSQLVLGDWAPMAHHFRGEDIGALNGILKTGFYHAVVANPPYVVPKDSSLNKLYRQRYETCHMKYSLAVPFMEQIFLLAVPGGFTGQITANSFMKRNFGKKLIEDFVPKIDLTHVIDTSGAYIPGHGTPTVILLGRNQAAVASVIRIVMGIRGEPTTPDDASKGLVWSSITKQIDIEGSESEFISVSDYPRSLLCSHPWTFGGGSATKLKELLESKASQTLSSVVDEIGMFGVTGKDEIFLSPKKVLQRQKIEASIVKPITLGHEARDWSICEGISAILPYQDESLLPLDNVSTIYQWLWPSRTVLGNRTSRTCQTYFAEGFPWWEWRHVVFHRVRQNLLIVFANIATHNHFVLDRGGKVFKQSAPLIKLPAGATEQEHLALLGLLNSAIACFWMKQVFHNKGDSTDQYGARTTGDSEFDTYEFAGTGLKQFPISEFKPTGLAIKIDSLAQATSKFVPANILQNLNSEKLQSSLEQAFEKWNFLRCSMISLQEELDWECYQHYGLLEKSHSYHSDPPPLQAGERAFEIVLGRQLAQGKIQTNWFERHKTQPITELPNHWPDDYQELIERRIELIERNKKIKLVEQPDYKRRWNIEPWDSQLQRALESWLLDRLESYFDFDGRMNDARIPTAKLPDPTLISTAKLADIARQDPYFLQVGELYRNDPAFNIQILVDELIDKQTIPHLPALRYKPTGLRKRQDWEHTWQLQRQEDAIDALTQLPPDDPNYLISAIAKQRKADEIGPIPVPPKYTTKDFKKGHYWKLRGKLDVPKERWVSFPHCEGPDGFPVIAWAGYNHLQLTQSISYYYVQVQENFGGRDDPRLIPLLGSLLEILPWLKQWHNDLDPTFDLKMGDYYEGFIQDEARQMGKTLDDIRAWEPPQIKSKRKRKSA